MSRNRPKIKTIAGRFFLVCSVLFIAFLPKADAEPDSSKSALPASRVFVSENAGATEMFLPKAEIVTELFRSGLLRFTGKQDETTAWRTLASTNDILGIKVFSAPGANSGTRPIVVAAAIESLLRAGFLPSQIIVWDKHYSDLRRAGFYSLEEKYNVRVIPAADAGWDEGVFYESAILGTPVWGDLEFGKKTEAIGRKSHVSKLLTQRITKIISISPLLNHNLAGVTGHLYSLSLGSVDNSLRFENRRERLETAIPEIVALPEIYDRLVLNITDALICQYHGEQRTLLHYSAALNQLWFSNDPVALDVLSLAELEKQRKRAGHPAVELKTDIYSNASLMELGVSNPKTIAVEPAKSSFNGE